jgi:hypothetical protein
MKDRKEILLRAAYDLLKRSTQDHYVREATSILTRFDEADCDGYCLMEDIAAELGLDNDIEPIPLGDTNASFIEERFEPKPQGLDKED